MSANNNGKADASSPTSEYSLSNPPTRLSDIREEQHQV
eukprot:CAMPEP_0169417976 /NCGR_PEP_ID=MMETSP1017-20121227/64030_1 /TAXON_ID=342587 /ORGANISM="Karlodinium micrum, Strain CCMP2283" /LENGTH=37 /DNA_ID= /DNA_START= /DNA_END= /DNA_ORIENTATION=